MHPCRFQKTHCAPHQTFDPCAYIDMLAFDLLRMGFAHRVLRGIAIALVGTPAIGVKAGDAKRFEQGFALEKHLIFSPSRLVMPRGIARDAYRMRGEGCSTR